MKLTAFLLLISVFGVLANRSYSQTLSLNMENTTLKAVLLKIEDISGCNFLYSEKFIDVQKKVSINVENNELDDVLKSLFSNADVKMERKGRIIILSPNTDSSVQQQEIAISGRVTDSAGAPLPGVTVVVKGTTNGVITDAQGKYSLTNIPGNATLIFSFVGMKGQEIQIAGKTTVNIVMTEESIGIEEVVAVGYGTQKKASIVGSISTVQSQDLTVAPVASTSNTLSGRLPGLITVQREGLPGKDAASLNIRGFGSPLVIVDGVESNLDILNPNTIESISILKDGAASIYGSRAGNGVILVTTKRGGIEKPTFTFNTTSSWQGSTVFPKKANAGQWAEMEREAWIQAGKPEETAPYSLEEIQKYYDGSDPRYYPNTDWYKEVTRKWAPQQEHNLSVRGGSERIKYFGFLGYLKQETMWKKNGGDYQKYNFQSNVDIKLTETLDMQVDVSAIERKINYSYRNETVEYPYLWQDLWYANPTYQAHFPDPTKLPYLGTNVPINAVTDRELNGYNDTDAQRLTGTLTLNYQIRAVKGLSAKLLVNYLKDDSNIKQFAKGYQMWEYSYEDDLYTLRADTRGDNRMELWNNRSRVITSQFSLNYDRTFSNDHHLTALAVYEAIDYKSDYFRAGRTGFISIDIDQMYAGSGTTATNDGSASEMGRVSYIGRLNYSFKEKYLLESTFRADASAKFPSENRWGYFPSVLLGWRLSEENFIANLGLFDNLKLKASYGESGNDAVGNFQYLAGYAFRNVKGTYLFGNTNKVGIYPTGLANPDLTWEEMSLYNMGLEFSMWKRKLYGEADVFYRERNGIAATRILSLPTTFGASLPPENINSLNDRGFELKIGTYGRYRDLIWDISANVAWSRAKWDHYEEPEYEDPDQLRQKKRSGRWTDAAFGYVSDGLFTSQEEIDNLGFDLDQKGNATLRPGDVSYVDVNDDKILDWKDMVEIGKGTLPHWTVGLNTNLAWKNFDLSALWQGALGFYHYVNLIQPMATFYDLRWTEESNDPNALVPRLGGAPTNGLYSDYRLKKADYLRLKTASLGYNLPQRWLSKVNISKLRVYVAGTNLLTFSGLKKYDLDPEVPSTPSSAGNAGSGWYYPQQKTVTIGANISF